MDTLSRQCHQWVGLNSDWVIAGDDLDVRSASAIQYAGYNWKPMNTCTTNGRLLSESNLSEPPVRAIAVGRSLHVPGGAGRESFRGDIGSGHVWCWP